MCRAAAAAACAWLCGTAAAQTKLTDGNLFGAVAQWLADPSAATVEYGAISMWDTGQVTHMAGLFAHSAFNEGVSNWDTAAVTSMQFMFSNTSFNRDVSQWDTSAVLDMRSMYSFNGVFDQDLSAWETKGVTDFSEMFFAAASFDQSLRWCVEPNVAAARAFQGTPCAAKSCGAQLGECSPTTANSSTLAAVNSSSAAVNSTQPGFQIRASLTAAGMTPADASDNENVYLEAISNLSGVSADAVVVSFGVGATPTATPTATPSAEPTLIPTATPTFIPTFIPTAALTAAPSPAPTTVPTATPTAMPTLAPTAVPTSVPTSAPTFETPAPTAAPTMETPSPTAAPTLLPVPLPTTTVPVPLPTTAAPTTAVPVPLPTTAVPTHQRPTETGLSPRPVRDLGTAVPTTNTSVPTTAAPFAFNFPVEQAKDTPTFVPVPFPTTAVPVPFISDLTTTAAPTTAAPTTAAPTLSPVPFKFPTTAFPTFGGKARRALQSSGTLLVDYALTVSSRANADSTVAALAALTPADVDKAIFAAAQAAGVVQAFASFGTLTVSNVSVSIAPTSAPSQSPSASPSFVPTAAPSVQAGVDLQTSPSLLKEGEKSGAVLLLSGARRNTLTLTANCTGGAVVFDPPALIVRPDRGDVVPLKLAAVDDFIDGGAAFKAIACVVAVSSVDARYDGLKVGFDVSLSEDDVSDVFLVDAALKNFYHVADGLVDFALVSSEYGGASGVVGVRFQSQPRAAVTVTAAASSSRVRVFPQVQQVQPKTWREPLWFMIDVSDDDDADGDAFYIVDLQTTSADDLYDNETRRVSFTVTEDDSAAVSLSASALQVGADRGGSTFPDSYEVSLTSRPLADVIVTLAIVNARNPEAARLSPSKLLFTAGDWSEVQTVNVASSAANAAFSVRHSVLSADSAYDSFALADVQVAVFVTVDVSPPPKLDRARFLDNGAGLFVRFDAATDGFGLVLSRNVFPCDVLFTNTNFGCKATGLDGDCRCEWAGKERANVTVSFGFGASMLPSSVSRPSFVGIKGGVLKRSLASVLSAGPQNTPAFRPKSPVRPDVAISAPSSVGLCDSVVLDATGATGAGSRKLSFTWGLSVEAFDAGVSVDFSKLARIISAANKKGDVTSLVLPSTTLTPTATYFATVTAVNYLGQGSTAGHRFFKSPVPAPFIKFEKGSMSMYRTEAKAVATIVALPDLRCTALKVESLTLVYFWRVVRLDVDPTFLAPELSAAKIAEYTAYPTTMRLPPDTLEASKSYLVKCTAAFANDRTLNTTALTVITVLSGNLVAKITGGVERAVSLGQRLTLDGSDSNDPDATASPMVYAWACDAAGVVFYDVGAAMAASSTNFAKIEAVFDSSLGGALIKCTLIVSKAGRNPASAETDVLVSADVALPLVRVTSKILAKYNQRTFFAVAFDSSSPDAQRACCETVWSSLDAPAGIFSKKVTASSPMLIDLGFAEPSAVYHLRLTATDVLGSSSSAVIEVKMNAPPTSGDFLVEPSSGQPVKTAFRFEMAKWSDDDDDLPFTYSFSHALKGRQVSLVADLYSSSSMVTMLPKPASSTSIAVYGFIYDRFGAFATESSRVELMEIKLSPANLTALSATLVSDALATQSGSEALSVISALASIVSSSVANFTTNTSAKDAEAYGVLLGELMEAVAVATVLVGTGASAPARGQALGAMEQLTVSSGLLSDATVNGALGVLTQVMATAPALDDDAAAAVTNAASQLLDTSLFADPDRRRLFARAFTSRRRLASAANFSAANSAAANSSMATFAPSAIPNATFDAFAATQLVDIIATTSETMIQDSFGGQSKNVVAKNLEVGAFRTDCGTRADGYEVGRGGRVEVPAAVLDVFGGCAEKNVDGAGGNVDVRIAQLKSVYPLEDTTSALVQVEVGSIDVELADAVLITLDTLEYEPSFASDFDLSTLERNGTCFNATDILTFDDCPYGNAVFDCGEALIGFFTDGSNVTLYAPPRGDNPVAVLVQCPLRAPQCKSWDRGRNDFSGHGCLVFAATPWNVTCACTNVFQRSGNGRDFASQAEATRSTARAVVKTLGSLSSADLFEALLILITLIALASIILLACCHGRGLDASDRAKRHLALQAERLEQFQGGLYDDVGLIDVSEFMGPAERQILVARWRAEQARGWLDRDQGNVFKAYSRAVEPTSSTNVGDFVWSMKRQHHLMQVVYLADGTFTRQERILLVAVMIFTNLFVEAFLIQFQPLDTESDQMSWPVLEAKLRYTLLSSFFAAVLNLPLAYAFKYARVVDGAPQSASRVDHYVNTDSDGLIDDVAHRELALRLTVLRKLTAVHEARAAQKLAASALLSEYARLCTTSRGGVGAALDRKKFASIHEATTAKYERDVRNAERDARQAENALGAEVCKHSDRKHALSLDEQALLAAEEKETRKLSYFARKVWESFISPLRQSLDLGKNPLPLPRIVGPFLCVLCVGLCLWCAVYVFGFAVTVNNCGSCDPPPNEVDFCLDRDRSEDDPFKRCKADACAGALTNYCGSGARATSLAWLECAVAATILALVLSEAFSIYCTSTLAKNAVKRLIGAGELAGKIQISARGIREKQRLDSSVAKCPVESEEKKEAWDGDDVTAVTSPRSTKVHPDIKVHPDVDVSGTPQADVPSVLSIDRADAWCCPCGERCLRSRRQAHLHLCTAFRDAWRGAIVDFLAAAGPDASARAVNDVAAQAQCSADVALCALAESRGVEHLAVAKLRHAAYRAEVAVVEVGVVVDLNRAQARAGAAEETQARAAEETRGEAPVSSVGPDASRV